MSITEVGVQSALKNLIDPNTKKDFVTGKSVKNVKVVGNDVSLDILLGRTIIVGCKKPKISN